MIGRFLAVFSLLLILFSGAAFAQGKSPFGVTLPSQSGPSTEQSFFGELSRSIYATQAKFYRAMTKNVSAMKEDGTAFWLLVGLSFLYGIVHAAGPGHGKVIITSYMLANEENAKRGIAISFAAAMVQAFVAIAIIVVAALIFNMTSIAINETARYFEQISFGLIIVLGVWLLWRKALAPLFAKRSSLLAKVRLQGGAQLATASASVSSSEGHNHVHHHHGHHDHSHGHSHSHSDHDHGHGHKHEHSHNHDHHHHGHSHHDHAHDHDCSCCGHVVDVEQAAKVRSFKDAWVAILSVGMRPCTGALIVLVFALSQGLFWAGIVSSFAMGVGTGLTVAMLATLAIYAKSFASKFAGGITGTATLYKGVEVAGALVIIFFGVTLLAGSLSA